MLSTSLSCSYLDLAMFDRISENAKYRILIAVALILGWFAVVFLRSGTAW